MGELHILSSPLMVKVAWWLFPSKASVGFDRVRVTASLHSTIISFIGVTVKVLLVSPAMKVRVPVTEV